MRENTDETGWEKIQEALTAPKRMKFGGAPSWYRSDDDAWAEFERQAPKRRVD